MSARTTLVDRRLAVLLFEGIAEDIPEETTRRHLRNKALFHKVEEALLRADLTGVDLEAVIRLLRPPTELSSEIRRFGSSVLDSVRALGGQFAKARMTEVPGGETLESQRRSGVIKFFTDWHFEAEEQARLQVAPSLASQVIYLPHLLEGSRRCTFEKVEDGRLSVQEVLDSLPKVEGLRWIIGNTPTINRILANHLEETGWYLLPTTSTWTTDGYEHPKYGLGRLLVCRFGSGGVDVSRLRPEFWFDGVGLFVLGVPE